MLIRRCSYSKLVNYYLFSIHYIKLGFLSPFFHLHCGACFCFDLVLCADSAIIVVFILNLFYMLIWRCSYWTLVNYYLFSICFCVHLVLCADFVIHVAFILKLFYVLIRRCLCWKLVNHYLLSIHYAKFVSSNCTATRVSVLVLFFALNLHFCGFYFYVILYFLFGDACTGNFYLLSRLLLFYPPLWV